MQIDRKDRLYIFMLVALLGCFCFLFFFWVGWGGVGVGGLEGGGVMCYVLGFSHWCLVKVFSVVQ